MSKLTPKAIEMIYEIADLTAELEIIIDTKVRPLYFVKDHKVENS